MGWGFGAVGRWQVAGCERSLYRPSPSAPGWLLTALAAPAPN